MLLHLHLQVLLTVKQQLTKAELTIYLPCNDYQID